MWKNVSYRFRVRFVRREIRASVLNTRKYSKQRGYEKTDSSYGLDRTVSSSFQGRYQTLEDMRIQFIFEAAIPEELAKQSFFSRNFNFVTNHLFCFLFCLLFLDSH